MPKIYVFDSEIPVYIVKTDKPTGFMTDEIELTDNELASILLAEERMLDAQELLRGKLFEVAMEAKLQKVPEGIREAGREVLIKLEEYFHSPVIVKPDEERPWMWAFAIRTNLPETKAQEIFEKFFDEYWNEVDNPKRLEGILVTLERVSEHQTS